MRLQETQQGGQQLRIVRPRTKLVRPDSGQLEEAAGPSLVAKRCCQDSKAEDRGIGWRNRGHSVDSSQCGSEGSVLAKIMIVEDNALNIKLFCDLLAAHGHQPEAVTDSRVALDKARAFKPDLVITDIQLPFVSGLELILMIRADEGLADVPIMAVTAYSAPGDEETIRAAGAQAYVSKPISVSKFAQTVEDLLEPVGQANVVTEGMDPGPGPG